MILKLIIRKSYNTVLQLLYLQINLKKENISMVTKFFL